MPARNHTLSAAAFAAAVGACMTLLLGQLGDDVVPFDGSGGNSPIAAGPVSGPALPGRPGVEEPVLLSPEGLYESAVTQKARQPERRGDPPTRAPGDGTAGSTTVGDSEGVVTVAVVPAAGGGRGDAGSRGDGVRAGGRPGGTDGAKPGGTDGAKPGGTDGTKPGSGGKPDAPTTKPGGTDGAKPGGTDGARPGSGGKPDAPTTKPGGDGGGQDARGGTGHAGGRPDRPGQSATAPGRVSVRSLDTRTSPQRATKHDPAALAPAASRSGTGTTPGRGRPEARGDGGRGHVAAGQQQRPKHAQGRGQDQRATARADRPDDRASARSWAARRH